MPTREEKLQTIKLANQLFENMTAQMLPSREECDQWRANIDRMSGKPQPEETPEERTALLGVLAEARKQREQQ